MVNCQQGTHRRGRTRGATTLERADRGGSSAPPGASLYYGHIRRDGRVADSVQQRTSSADVIDVRVCHAGPYRRLHDASCSSCRRRWSEGQLWRLQARACGRPRRDGGPLACSASATRSYETRPPGRPERVGLVRALSQARLAHRCAVRSKSAELIGVGVLWPHRRAQPLSKPSLGVPFRAYRLAESHSRRDARCVARSRLGAAALSTFRE